MNDKLKRYVILANLLGKLVDDGKETEAEALTECLDALWYQLTPTERGQARKELGQNVVSHKK